VDNVFGKANAQPERNDVSVQIARIGGETAEQYPAEIVGGKAANLARMAALGLPVPPAFVLPISLCAATVNGEASAAQDLAAALAEGIQFLEKTTGKKFGDRRRPLLVSVRSGAARSMPGMLDTVLNVGCSLPAVHGLVRMTGHPRFANDCRRRFLESYGTVVLGIDRAEFANTRDALVAAEHVGSEAALDCDAIEHLADAYEHVIEEDGQVLSDDPMEHLMSAAQAVFRSWLSDRARTYRRLQHLDDLQGTAVTVQAMVFGNAGRSSGAGVAFSRDPSTGVATPVIDVLFDSQGEDVVSGDHNPETENALAGSLPQAANELRAALRRLEDDFADVQDVEFTIENGKLWMLQTRAAKRTPRAALRLAVDFVKEGRISAAEGLSRLEGVDLRALVSKRLVIAAQPIGHGTCASSGIAVGPRRVRFRQRVALRCWRRPGHSGSSRHHDRGRCGFRHRGGYRHRRRRTHRACRIGRKADGQALYRRLHGAVG
jgi:pyruvate, orthophosphate dikinase